MLFERPDKNSNALLIHLDYEGSPCSQLEEFRELVTSAGYRPVDTIAARRHKPHPATFLGPGKIEEIKAVLQGVTGAVIVFDHDLTPVQERNLEWEFGCRVIGRTGLILDIFAQRAESYEGKLQVELAQLQHMRTRLVRGWTHLDRQRGGSGRTGGSGSVLGGAGETQLEADQRMIGQRIKSLNGRLRRVRSQRDQRRRARLRSDCRTVSLVGYTNAGKSTLFNTLSQRHVEAEDKLFATLDPTVAAFEVPRAGETVLADTVGFIRDLPHTLVDAFRATLEEVHEAALLLHVVDASASDRDEQIDAVNTVLEEIGADSVPQLLVFNKTDVTDRRVGVDVDKLGRPRRAWISAKTGAGLEELLDAISVLLSRDIQDTTVCLEPAASALRARFYEIGAVRSERVTEEGRFELSVRLESSQLQALLGKAGGGKRSN